MSNDLISRKELTEAIRQAAPRYVPLWVYETISAQPTAYDIDEIVKCLEEELSPDKECFDFEDDHIYADERHKRYIEIVKSGGRDEKR